MRTKDPMMEEPAFSQNLMTAGKKMIVVMLIILVSGATLLALISIFQPADNLDFEFSWIVGFQFMMLFVMDMRNAKLEIGRLSIGPTLMAVLTTSIFFAFGMLFNGG